MTSSEGFSSNKSSLFDGTNYSFWKLRMKTYISALGYEIWEATKNGYTTPSMPITIAADRKEYESNSKAKNAIMCGLVDRELVRVMNYKSEKEIWDKLKSIHEGDMKIKEAKLQTHQMQFEILKMNEDENIEAYMLRVNEVINAIKGLGEEIEDSVIVKKVLCSLPQIFDSKVSTIEEAKYLNTFNTDKMHGSLIAYEMRIGIGKYIDREAAFKAKKTTKAMPEYNEEETSDELEVNFIHNLKKGTRGKYRGKLPFKFFNCGAVGHFVAKYPYNEKSKEDESSYRERSGWKTKSHFRKYNLKKIKFIFKNISSSEASSNEDLEEEASEVLFMAFEEENLEIKQKLEEEIDEEEVEIEVDLEGELITALE